MPPADAQARPQPEARASARSTTQAQPPPVVSVRGLGARTRRGWVFREVDLDVYPGELIALTGTPGSGRTSLLLALAGRFRTTDGTRSAGGTAALGLVSGAHELDPALTVAEHVVERLALLGGPRPLRPVPLLDEARVVDHRRLRSGRRRWATHLLAGFPVPPDTLARDLDPYPRHLLCLLLALVADPALIVVDDIDEQLTLHERWALWAELRRVADAGIAVVGACREVDPSVPDRIITLPANRHPSTAGTPGHRPPAGGRPAHPGREADQEVDR